MTTSFYLDEYETDNEFRLTGFDLINNESSLEYYGRIRKQTEFLYSKGQFERAQRVQTES